MSRIIVSISALALLAGCADTQPEQPSPSEQPSSLDWPNYGQDPGGMRFSELDQINASNVAELEVAWVYHMLPESSEANGFQASQLTPLVVGGVMYLATPYNQVVALNPVSGEEIWTYHMPEGATPARRGVEYWPGDEANAAQLMVGTENGLVVALNAETGQLATSFAESGILNLQTEDMVDPSLPPRSAASLRMTSPPLVYQNLLITGAATGEFPPRGVKGDVRAWDVRTGQLVWRFDPVPRPGEFGYDTWEEGSAEWRRGVTVWGFMTVDVERAIVYMPFGAPAWDRYGGDRKGENLFGSSIVAADANTGDYLWHFQVVRHDIWDYDTQAPPALFDVHKDGETIPAVAIINKAGLLFLLNRESGEPIHGIEDRQVPPSEVPGEEAWPTQPFPVRPEPLARNSFSMEDVATVTPELQAYCTNWIEDNNMAFGGPYIPFGYNQPTILFPGFQGGSNWQGVSFSPLLGYLFVNTTDMGQVYSLRDAPEGSELPVSGGPLSSRFFQAETRLMCQEPPWGRLSAVDVSTGEIVWQSVLGVSDNVPEDKRLTGRPNVGGTIATAGDVVFIGATDDARFRAFHAQTGELLWEIALDAAAHATPITYLGEDGRQYVVVSSTGGSFLRSPITSDTVVAWALPTEGIAGSR